MHSRIRRMDQLLGRMASNVLEAFYTMPGAEPLVMLFSLPKGTGPSFGLPLYEQGEQTYPPGT
jgi:hypothetical protein